jgi:arachidonate 15-lipoxygenase
LSFVAQGIIPNRLARHCLYWLFVYSFFECSGFSPELEKRGFDASFDIPCYLFREDGNMIWEAYGKFAANFVDEIYETDEQVKADAGLQEWAQETTEKAAINGFPKSFKDKHTLVKTLQTLGWISVNHAAVNFPQYDVSSMSLASR